MDYRISDLKETILDREQIDLTDEELKSLALCIALELRSRVFLDAQDDLPFYLEDEAKARRTAFYAIAQIGYAD